MRIVFAGTPAFAAAHLQALLDHGFEVVAVYTQPDRPAGRGKKLAPSPVKALALAHGLPLRQPASLRAPEEEAGLRDLRPDVMVVVAYGLLLPGAILRVPRHGCLNVHASLLPRWRGAAPIERAILAGDEETGVTVMQMDGGLDTGDMLYRLSTPIQPQDNSATLTERLRELGCQALVACLKLLGEGSLSPQPQDDAASTYAAKLGKEEALIDWNHPAATIQRQVNAFNTRSPAWCLLGEERLRLLEALALERRAEASPGTILEAAPEGLLVACGEGCLRITQVQLPGKNPVGIGDLLNARQAAFAPGTRLVSPAPGA